MREQEQEREADPWGWVFAEVAAGERVPAGAAGDVVRGPTVTAAAARCQRGCRRCLSCRSSGVPWDGSMG